MNRDVSRGVSGKVGRKVNRKVGRVVIYRLGSLGDTVVALPCLHKVAQVFPDAERIVLTNFPVSSKTAPLEAVLGGSGLVQRYMAYPVGTRSVQTLAALRASLRALQADTLVYLTPARGLLAAWRDLLFFRWCGFKHIVGVPLTHGLQQHRRGTDGALERECERLARCLQPLGPVELADPAAWNLQLTAAETTAAAGALRRTEGFARLAINMGGKLAANDWGETRWQALLQRLQPLGARHALVFVGGAEDRQRAARAGAQWPGPVVNLCGQASPRVSAAAMAGAVLFIGHDSGPLHMAASVGVPCVGLYGDHNAPRKWHPYGPAHHIIHDMRGVQAIAVDSVVQAVQAALRTRLLSSLQQATVHRAVA